MAGGIERFVQRRFHSLDRGQAKGRDRGIFERHRRAVGVADADGIGIDKTGVAGKQLALVSFVETLTHAGLLIYDRIRMTQDIGKAGAHGARVIAVERILVKFDDSADGVTQCFGRDGAPMCTTATDVVIAFDDSNPGALFNQSHRGAFSARA